MLEKLKAIFRGRGPEVEYRSQLDEGPVVIPAGPPSGQMPPVAPVDDPGADAKTGDDGAFVDNSSFAITRSRRPGSTAFRFTRSCFWLRRER